MARNPHRFRLHRAGILNVWQYDEQVFEFADGRLLLRGTIAYVPDRAARGEATDGLVTLIDGVDVLPHDAQFVESERTFADVYSHSTVGDAVDLATRLDVGRLVLFHHGPARTDDRLEAMLQELKSPLPVTMAREGQVLEVAAE
jgi:ribonuclease BN (tRNA processing enzyme)